MEEIVVEFSPEEKAALEALAKSSYCSLEEVIVRTALAALINKGLLNESAERNGWKVMRLDE